MNNKFLILTLWCALLLYFLSPSQAQENGPANEPQTHTMSLLWLADKADECVIVFDNSGFKSLGSPTLRGWLKNHPKGTTILYFPGCVPWKGKPTEQ